MFSAVQYFVYIGALHKFFGQSSYDVLHLKALLLFLVTKETGNVSNFVVFTYTVNTHRGVGINSGMDYWNEILYWSTGMHFYAISIMIDVHASVKEVVVLCWLDTTMYSSLFNS